MHFERTYLYHIYNQGNNRQLIFFNRENYLFFLRKVRKQILTYCDILAYCLMPNHFHFLVLVNEVELIELVNGSGSETQSRTPTYNSASKHVTQSCTPTSTSGSKGNSKCIGADGSGGPTSSRDSTKIVTLQKSIGILLASYTRAINKQENTTGSLFRQKTKAACLSCPEIVIPDYLKSFARMQNAKVFCYDRAKEYPTACFNYIHENPVTAGLVGKAEAWEFSSVKDYYGLREGKLVNMELAKQYIHFFE